MHIDMSLNHTHCIRVIDHWSMTRMQLLSYSKKPFFPLYRGGQWKQCIIVNDTNVHWWECKSHSVHLCHWLLVNDRNAHWYECKSHSVHPCYWLLVNDTNAVPDLANTKNIIEIEASDWSRAQNPGFSLVERPLNFFLRGFPFDSHSAFVSLTTGQWHKCRYRVTRKRLFFHCIGAVNDTNA